MPTIIITLIDCWNGTLDYIWYSKDHFTPITLKQLINKETASTQVALPNKDYSSDHLSLYCVLGLL